MSVIPVSVLGSLLTEREIIDGIKRVLEHQLGKSVDLSDRSVVLTESFGLDSLDRVELAMLIEEEFGICPTDAAEDAVITVNDLIALITAETAKTAGLAEQVERTLMERAEASAALDAARQTDPFSDKE